MPSSESVATSAGRLSKRNTLAKCRPTVELSLYAFMHGSLFFYATWFREPLSHRRRFSLRMLFEVGATEMMKGAAPFAELEPKSQIPVAPIRQALPASRTRTSRATSESRVDA